MEFEKRGLDHNELFLGGEQLLKEGEELAEFYEQMQGNQDVFIAGIKKEDSFFQMRKRLTVMLAPNLPIPDPKVLNDVMAHLRDEAHLEGRFDEGGFWPETGLPAVQTLPEVSRVEQDDSGKERLVRVRLCPSPFLAQLAVETAEVPLKKGNKMMGIYKELKSDIDALWWAGVHPPLLENYLIKGSKLLPKLEVIYESEPFARIREVWQKEHDAANIPLDVESISKALKQSGLTSQELTTFLEITPAILFAMLSGRQVALTEEKVALVRELKPKELEEVN